MDDHTTHPTDAMIVAASLAEPECFAELFDRHWRRIRSYCIARAGAAGEDIAADTFRIAFDGRAAYDGRYADATPWLYGIATNRVRRHFRTEHARASADRRDAGSAPGDAGVEHDHAPTTIGRLEAEYLGPRLVTAIGGLRSVERDAILLHAWESLSYAEIAVALDIPIGTVRSRIHRARTALQSQLLMTRKEHT